MCLIVVLYFDSFKDQTQGLDYARKTPTLISCCSTFNFVETLVPGPGTTLKCSNSLTKLSQPHIRKQKHEIPGAAADSFSTINVKSLLLPTDYVTNSDVYFVNRGWWVGTFSQKPHVRQTKSSLFVLYSNRFCSFPYGEHLLASEHPLL